MMITSEYLVFGATEGTGYAFSSLLMDKQIPFTIFAEDLNKVPAVFKTSKFINVIEGRTDDPPLMEKTLNDRQYVFLGNDYTLSEWKEQAINLFRSIITAVTSGRPTLIYPGTVLQFAGGMPVTERAAPRPACRRGILEVKLEDILLEAVVEKKCKVMIMRFPELYGPGVVKTDISAVFSAVARGKRSSYPVNIDSPRQFAYSEDAAEVTFRVLKQHDKDFFSVFNYAGNTYSSVRSFIKQIQEQAGLKQNIKVHSKRKIRLLSFFSHTWREKNERKHFFEQSFLIDDSRSRKLVPDFEPTASTEAIANTLHWFRSSGNRFNA
ncbi:NAD-dependent epimerase/dehydratase family protein [Chitinophaga sp. CF418]|uniref:NAD-dependent epimerase/dehydratase family protein n=1 Tax=Chitinophaga sp. CF418 TaxID=1855287 RepID=UPI00091033AD|nr:NAD-dependent epimerase/dehydratase family protein [Chitinophaga sp. CF418]SHN35850.1 Nucleoside-diphosphate-sugar epimerase [Chitinophaga sp. CF418]